MKTVFAFLLMLLSVSIFAQNRQHAFDVNKRLGRGINYGNMFEAPSLTEWGNPWKPQYAQMIARQGFNHIRVPIRWEPAARSLATAPYTITPAFLAQIKQVVDSALRNKLHVIINMHHHDALFADPDGQKPRFLAQWNQISEYFKNYPDSLLFEILNEPNGNVTPAKWNLFFADALTTIRQSNPSRIVVIGTAEWGGLSGLQYLQLPPDENIIVTVHYYNPFQFTHQGASWVGNGTEANAWLGTKWNDSDIEREVVKSEFAPLVAFGKTKNVPIHIGEFGAYSKADDISRKKWTTYISRYLESVGFSWAYWEFSAGFGIYNPANGSWNQFLVDALLRNSLPEPARYVGTPVYTSNFSTSTDGWVVNKQGTAAAQLSRANNSLVVSFTNAGTETWHVQLVKNNIALADGKKYRLSFKAKSATSRTGTVYVGMNKDPWSAYSGYNGISMADTFAVYNFLFDMKGTDAAARIVFDLGKSATTTYVTELKLEEVVLQWPTGITSVNSLKTTVFPNPATDKLYINNLDDFNTITLLNIEGKPVLERKIDVLLNEIDMGNLAKGLYFVRLSGKDKTRVIKVLKAQ